MALGRDRWPSFDYLKRQYGREVRSELGNAQHLREDGWAFLRLLDASAGRRFCVQVTVGDGRLVLYLE
jgi:hypothetical protein